MIRLNLFRSTCFVAGALFVISVASVAKADLDTLGVYGNGDGPSIDGSTTSGFVNNGGGSYSITAGGSDHWGNSDNGVFLYDSAVTTAGNFTAIVRSESFTGPDPLAGEWGRTGPMARASDAADSANVMTAQKSGGGVGLTQQGRRSNGGGTERDFGEWAGTGALAANGGVPVWLALSRTTLPQGDFFVSHYAEDAGGAPGAWSDARFRPVTPDLAGGLLVGLAHQSHSIPRVNTANFDNWSLGAYDSSLPAVAFPSFLASVPADLPAGGVGNFGVLEVTNNGGIGNQDDVLRSMRDGGGVRVGYQAPMLNYNENGGEGVIPAGGPFQTEAQGLLAGDSVGPDAVDKTNNISIMAQGTIRITEAGEYTFRTDSDDGFRVLIPGQNFTSASNGGLPVFEEGIGLEFFGGRGTAATTGTVNLPAGDHKIFWTYHEGGGGAAGELTYSFGQNRYAAVGDADGLPSIPSRPLTVALTANANVVNGAFAGDIAAARAEILNNAVNDPSSPKSDVDIAVVSDGGGRPGADMGLAVPFPNGGGDNFTTGIFGNFAVDNGNGVDGEAVQLTFGLFSDDNAQLHVIGQNFEAVAGGSVTLADVDGDQALTADFRTGNTNAFGHITLTEGTYDFEAFHLEEGGGAGVEVWFADGFLTAFDSEVFAPLSLATATAEVPAMPGMALVPEPSSATLAGLAIASLFGLARRRRK